MKVLCIGESSYNLSVNSTYFPVENSVNNFENRVESTGGLISNVAYFLGKSNIDVYMATMVGNDDYGVKIKKDLEEARVKCDFIETSYQDKTNIRINLYNTQNGTNTLYYLNNRLSLKKYAYNIIPEIYVLDGTEYSASLAALEKFRDSKSILVIKDATKENVDLAKYAKTIIFSKEAAEKLMNMSINYNDGNSIVNIYNALKANYPNSEIILNVAMYGVVYTLGNEIKIIPAINSIDRVDLNCETEAFVSGYVYGLASNFDIENSIMYGLISSALTVSRVGMRDSMAKLDEIVNYYNQKFNIQVNPVQPTQNIQPEGLQVNDNTQNPQA